jgi:hypothetical protein
MKEEILSEWAVVLYLRLNVGLLTQTCLGYKAKAGVRNSL